MADETEIPAPGLNIPEIPNLGPVIDPPFSDARDWGRFLAKVQTRPVAVEDLEPALTADDARRAAELALASERVRRAIDHKRHEVLSVGMRTIDRRTERPVVVVYNYADDVVLEVSIDLTCSAVLDVKSERYQPPLADSERGVALDLVRKDGRLARDGVDVETGNGIIVEDEDVNSRRYGHRLVDLRFGPANLRLPTAFAIVDLSGQDIVRLGTIGIEGGRPCLLAE